MVANERIKIVIYLKTILNGSVEDNGTAIGAGLAASAKLDPRKSSRITDYYGRHYNHGEILDAVAQYNFSYDILSEKKP